MKKQQHYKAALYCRLSVDDGNFGGSVSIETQKILLEQYCKDHKITDYKFYCDDGCSGTNFDRPSFKKCFRTLMRAKSILLSSKTFLGLDEIMSRQVCMFNGLPTAISDLLRRTITMILL